jgi:hypothetical protein
MIVTYPVGQLLDDSGAILSAPVVTIASVTDKAGTAIGSPGATVNGSGTATPISIDYDAEVKGEAWITLSVSQATKTVTGANASIALYAARDSSRLNLLLATMVLDVVQAAPAPTTTVFAGSAALNGTVNTAYQNSYLCFVTGANAGEAHRIQSYVASTRTFTMTAAFPAAPAAGDQFVILARNE